MKIKVKKECFIQYRGESKDLIRNYNMEMQMVRKSPKVYYSKDGGLKSIK